MTPPTDALLRIAGLLRDRALADLAAAEADRQALARDLDRLAEARRSVLGAEDATAPAAAAAADRYVGWTEARMRILRPALARAAAEEETRRKAAARAFGRAQALEEVAKRRR